jgi:hypothetical protein
MNRRLVELGAALCALVVSPTPLAAQRTFVASYGDDGYACTIAAPCRAFGPALVKTDPGGEIIVLDSAGYGAVNITKPVSIIAPPGVYAGITVFSGMGVVVNPGSGTVVLSGLTLEGQGGMYGIQFLSGSELRVERTSISGFSGTALYAAPAATASLFVHDSAFFANQSGVGAMTSGGTLTVVIDGTRFDRNTTLGGIFRDNVVAVVTRSRFSRNGDGVFVQPSGAGTTARLTLRDCVIAGNDHGLVTGGFANTTTTVAVTDSEISDNAGGGIQTQFGSTVTVSNTTVTRNNVGLATLAGSTLQTYQDNRVHGNSTNGAFTATVAKQ